MEAAVELRQALVHAVALAWLECRQSGARPEVERVALLLDDALEALDSFGLDARGVPPEDWQAA